MRRTIDFNGVPVEVVSDAEAEKCDFVVCVLAGTEEERFKATNVYTTCSICGVGIAHRPYVPSKPPKVCVPCVLKMAEKEGAPQ